MHKNTYNGMNEIYYWYKYFLLLGLILITLPNKINFIYRLFLTTKNVVKSKRTYMKKKKKSHTIFSLCDCILSLFRIINVFVSMTRLYY